MSHLLLLNSFILLYHLIINININWFMNSMLSFNSINTNSQTLLRTNNSTTLNLNSPNSNSTSTIKSYQKKNYNHNNQRSYIKRTKQYTKIYHKYNELTNELYSDQANSSLKKMKIIAQLLEILQILKQYQKSDFTRNQKLNNLKSRYQNYLHKKNFIQENISNWLLIVNHPSENQYNKIQLDNLKNLHWWLEQQKQFQGLDQFGNDYLLDNIKTSITKLQTRAEEIIKIENQVSPLLIQAINQPLSCQKIKKLNLLKDRLKICYDFNPFSKSGMSYTQVEGIIKDLNQKKDYLQNELKRGLRNLRNCCQRPVSLQILIKYKEFMGDFS